MNMSGCKTYTNLCERNRFKIAYCKQKSYDTIDCPSWHYLEPNNPHPMIYEACLYVDVKTSYYDYGLLVLVVDISSPKVFAYWNSVIDFKCKYLIVSGIL